MSAETNPSLLVRVRDADDTAAWQQFVELYAPLIHHYGRRHGLQDADAADLVQDVMQAVARNLSKFDYDPHKGSFRGWLLTITRNKLLDAFAKSQKQQAGAGDTRIMQMLHEYPANDDAYWEQQHRWRLVQWAAEQIQSEFEDNTWQAFNETAIRQQPAAQVAAKLGISVGAVYIAKSRVLARIKTIVQPLEAGDD